MLSRCQKVADEDRCQEISEKASAFVGSAIFLSNQCHLQKGSQNSNNIFTKKKYTLLFFRKKKTYVASESCRPMTPNLGLGPGMLLSELCHLASAFEKGRDRPRLRPCSELLIFTLYTTTKDQELKKEPRLLKLQIHTRGWRPF